MPRVGITVREGELSQASLMAALDDETRRGLRPTLLVVSDRELERRASRILAMGTHPFDALRGLMPRVACITRGLPAGGWCLLGEENALPGSAAWSEEVAPAVQCSPAGTS